MKSQISWVRDAGMLLAVLLLTNGCLQQVSETAQQAGRDGNTDSAPADTFAQLDSSGAGSSPDNSNAFADEPGEKAQVSDAPAVAVSDEIAVPSSIHPGPGLIEVLKLIDSSVEESVLLAYVTNSTERFDLGPDEIIFLNDIGLPGRVITAMLQRDHILQALAAGPSTWETTLPIALNENTEPEPVPNPDAGVDSLPPGYLSDSYVQDNPPVPPTTAPLFYDALAPYGSWVDVDGYGRCWQPTVVTQDSEWQPYLDHGRWVYTDCGWYWKSDYSWGWAAFHYGRWFRHTRLGWCWSPDDVWAPSWVCWRTCDDYCGWAPLPPGAGFNVAGDLCWHGRPCAPNFHFGLGSDFFHFVASNDFSDSHVSHRVIPRAKVPHIFHRTVVSNPISGSNHVVSNNGAFRDRIAAALHHDVPRVTLRETDPATTHASRDRFESNGKVLAMYRPRVGGSLLGPPGVANAGSSRTQSRAGAGRVEVPQAHETTVVGAPNRPANHQPAASTAGTTRSVPPLILRGSDLSTRDRIAANGGNRSHDASSSQSSSHSTASNWRETASLRPGAPAISGSGSSLVVIGHRGGGGHESAQGSIKVFSTPPAAISHQPQQQSWTDSGVQRASYHASRSQAPAQEQPRNQTTETVPWWLTRATPNQAQATREDGYSAPQQPRPEPRQHFDRGYGGRADNNPGSSQPSPSSAPVHSQVSQARTESHSAPPPPSAAPAPQPAASAAPAAASHSSSASSQSLNSGGGRR